MGKRFRSLERALRYIKSPTGSGTADAPAGSALKEYQDWRAKKREITYTRDEGSNPDKLLTAVLNPFGLTIDPDNQVAVKLSQRASTVSIGGAMKTACNYDTETTDGIKRLTGFIPAKATVFLGTGATTTVSGGSKITGIPYKKRGGASYSFPYGASTGDPRESDVRGKILTAVKAINNASVSFSSEKL